MDKKQAINILEEYTNTMAIQRSLLSHCKLDKDSRVRRGPLQKLIAKELNLTVNPTYYKLFNNITTHLNLTKITVQGISYYKGISLRV